MGCSCSRLRIPGKRSEHRCEHTRASVKRSCRASCRARKRGCSTAGKIVGDYVQYRSLLSHDAPYCLARLRAAAKDHIPGLPRSAESVKRVRHRHKIGCERADVTHDDDHVVYFIQLTSTIYIQLSRDYGHERGDLSRTTL